MHRPLFSLALLLLTVALCLQDGFLRPVQAESSRIVRVGVFPLSGYNRIEDNQVSGYNASYLAQVANYAAWTPVYVILDNWQAALTALDQGRIDLLSPALRTPERAERYLYCPYSSGTAYTALMTPNHNAHLVYEDFAAIARLRIGSTRGTTWMENFAAYARRKGFTPPRLMEYADISMARSAMRAGEVEAILGTIIGLEDHEKVLAKYDPLPFFYITRPDNAELMAELAQAIARIKLEQPDLESRLASEYLPRSYQTPLSKAELDYIAASPPLRVGYSPARKPLAWQDAAGQAQGILPDMLRLAGQLSGLGFVFVPLTDINLSLENYFEQNLVDIGFSAQFGNHSQASSAARFSVPLLRNAIHLYGPKGHSTPGTAPFTLALSEHWRSGLEYAAAFPQARVRLYPTADDCLAAIVGGEADVTLGNGMVVNALLGVPRFRNITMLPGFTDDEDIRLVLRNGMPPILLSILNKTLYDVDESRKDLISAAHLITAAPPLSLGDMLYERSVQILLLSGLAVFGLLLAALACWLRYKNRACVQASERHLACVTDNLVGGVLSLASDRDLRILEANKGFWHVLGYTADPPQVRGLVDLLPPSDVKKLRQSLMVKHQGPISVGLELRMRHQNGQWLPVLLRGTLTPGEGAQPPLHCLMVDITYLKNMRKELEQEKERYRILLEQSQDIILDVDMKKRQIQCSPNFFVKFGPDALPLFSSDDQTTLSKVIHPDDIPAFNELRRLLRTAESAVSGVMRIVTAEGRYLWCRTQTVRISRKNAPLHFVSKIVDIDDEVRQRAELERRSQSDSLTGLYNKMAFKEKVSASLPVKAAPGKVDALLFLDLDNFKQINDTLGHMVGDAALMEVAEVLRHTFRNDDVVSRFGGDEFCIYTRGITRQALKERAEAVLAGLRAYFARDVLNADVTASVGIYLFDGAETSYEEALQRADKAQYHAKKGGKGMVVFYDEVDLYDDMELSDDVDLSVE